MGELPSPAASAGPETAGGFFSGVATATAVFLLKRVDKAHTSDYMARHSRAPFGRPSFRGEPR